MNGLRGSEDKREGKRKSHSFEWNNKIERGRGIERKNERKKEIVWSLETNEREWEQRDIKRRKRKRESNEMRGESREKKEWE